MGFADALAETATGGRVQRVDQLLATLDDEDRQVALAALRDPTVSCERIANAFKKLGHSLSAGSVKNWRRLQ